MRTIYIMSIVGLGFAFLCFIITCYWLGDEDSSSASAWAWLFWSWLYLIAFSIVAWNQSSKAIRKRKKSMEERIKELEDKLNDKEVEK